MCLHVRLWGILVLAINAAVGCNNVALRLRIIGQVPGNTSVCSVNRQTFVTRQRAYM